MSSLSRLLPLGVAAIVLGTVVWLGYSRLYATPKARLLDEIARVRDENARLSESVDGRILTRREMQRALADGLGGSRDLADHVLRTALREVAVTTGLSDVRITVDRPSTKSNPYSRAGRGTNASLRRTLSRQMDFALVSGRIEAVGTLEQALMALALVEAQPWVGRIDRVFLRPQGQDRDRFDVTLATTTLYAPDVSPSRESLALSPVNGDSSARWRPIVVRNVFKEPPPPPAPPRETQPRQDRPPPPPPPPPPPYHEWRLSGVIESRRGTEVILQNTRTKGSQVLGVGGSVLGATLVEGAGERAVFEIDGGRYEFRVNESLSLRRAAQ